jgi:hypothetical protein
MSSDNRTAAADDAAIRPQRRFRLTFRRDAAIA